MSFFASKVLTINVTAFRRHCYCVYCNKWVSHDHRCNDKVANFHSISSDECLRNSSGHSTGYHLRKRRTERQ